MPTSKQNKPASQIQNGAINQFARALAETEKPFAQNKNLTPNQNSLFSQALSRSSDQFAPNDQNELIKQQEEAEKQRKKEIQRKKLHDQVNPVDLVDVFSQREKQVKNEIDQIRKELKGLVQDIKKLHKEVDIAVMQEVVNPGQDGAYYINFYQQLRNFIILLRQRVKSANTWAKQMSAKSAKKKRRGKFSTGVDMSGKSFEQSTAVFDTMHHERSNAYAGG